MREERLRDNCLPALPLSVFYLSAVAVRSLSSYGTRHSLLVAENTRNDETRSHPLTSRLIYFPDKYSLAHMKERLD